MKKTFQKTLVAAAAGVALMSAVGTASANSLMFPYFTTVGSAQSVISLYTNANASGAYGSLTNPAAALEALHYVYNYGAGCAHYDGFGKMSANDLLQHSVSATGAAGFGKVTGNDGSTPFYLSVQDFGFLTVTSKTTAAAKVISGDMVVIDPATSLVVSYAAISNDFDTSSVVPTTTVVGNEGNFAAITDANFNLSWYPTGLVDTSWFGVVAGNMNARIVANASWNGTANVTTNGIVYDNDEQPFSGLADQAISCMGTVHPGATSAAKPKGLLTPAQAAAIGAAGGLFHANANAFAGAATGLMLHKMQFIKPAVGGIFANKQMLHREPGAAW